MKGEAKCRGCARETDETQLPRSAPQLPEVHAAFALRIPFRGPMGLLDLDLKVFLVVEVAGAVARDVRAKAGAMDLSEKGDVLLATKPVPGPREKELKDYNLHHCRCGRCEGLWVWLSHPL